MQSDLAGIEEGGRPPDVSLILTLHDEGPLVRRTLLSLEDAAAYARRLGIRTELVAVLDCADAPTRRAIEAFRSPVFDRQVMLATDHGSLGLARNSGIAVARGRFLCMCDADDLTSFNAIAEMARLADTGPPGALILPEYLLAFGTRHHFVRYYPLAVVTPLSLLSAHPFTGRVFGAARVFRDVGYRDVRLTPGHAYEDWHFAAECVARGHVFLTARDTILFYRQRQGSLLSRADAISVRQIPPSRLFEPAVWRRVTAEACVRTQRAPAAFTQVAHNPSPRDLDRPVLRALVAAANRIDPDIDLAAVRQSPFFSPVVETVIAAGRAYHEICGALEGRGPFDEVFVLPFDGVGGADIYLRNVMRALHEADPGRRMLVLLGEGAGTPSPRQAAPPGAVVIDLAGDRPGLGMADRCLMALKLIEAVAPSGRIRIRDSVFGQAFFGTYWPVLGDHPAVFYHFSDPVALEGDDLMSRATGFDFVSTHIGRLAMVISDTETQVERDRGRIGLYAERFQALMNRRVPLVDEAQVAARTACRKRRMLWASRLDAEKRPELLPRLAQVLAELDPGVTIEVFGEPVLDRFDPSTLEGRANLAYRGPFRGFESLDFSAYDGFVYTSRFDGMPNVVLEAMAAGLPVIAPAVGGIGEMVLADETGILLDLPPDDAAAARLYAEAIRRLGADAALRTRLAEAALRRLAARHGADAHRRRVRELFLGDDRHA